MKSFVYHSETGLKREDAIDNLVEKVGAENLFIWVDIGEENFQSEVNRVGENLNLHPLTLEDILTAGSRSLVDFYQDYIYILARVPSQEWELGNLETNQLSMVIGSNYLLTFHRASLSSTNKLVDKVDRDPARYLGRGVDYLGYNILDELVESYFPVLDKLEEEIERVEDEVLGRPDKELLARISHLRKDLIVIQRTTNPQRDMAAKLARSDMPFIADERKIYFRDIQDNLARIVDLLSNYRDLVGGARDMYMTAMSNRMNEIMKTLTIVATIFIPLTFIAGVYGMNFEVMPELGWGWGYYGVLGVMGTVALGMIYYFKKNDWF